MEPTLYIHIGGIGSGTAALGRFLSGNRAELVRRGIAYSGMQGQRRCGVAIPQSGPLDIRQPAIPEVRKFLRGFPGRGEHACIVSLQSTPGDGLAGIFRGLVPEGTATKVVYYAGRQDDLLEAWYRHLVESPEYRYAGVLDDALADRLASLFDHAAVLRPWADAFGPENVIVRCCDDVQTHGGIFQDFLGVIGVVPERKLAIPPVATRKRMTREQTEFLRLCNARLRDNPGVHHFLCRQFRKSRFCTQQGTQYFRSPLERQAFVERFDAPNREVAQKYLNREDGGLFSQPLPDLNDHWVPFTGLTTEQLAPVFMELVYEHQAAWEHPHQPLQILFSSLNNRLARATGSGPSENLESGAEREPAEHQAPGSGSPGSGNPPQITTAAACTIDEMVPRVALRIYTWHGQVRQVQPMSTVFQIMNHGITRTFFALSPRYQKRLRDRLT